MRKINSSSGLKPKGPQHSQDRECGAFITNCGQNNAWGISSIINSKKYKQLLVAPNLERQFMNRQQPHATMESEKKKMQTEKDKLGNHHDDPEYMVNGSWYKVLWWELKKQAKKVAYSNADADSSSDESMSDEEQLIFHKFPKKSIKTPTKKRPSNSTRHELEEHFVSDNIIRFSSPERVMIVSKEKVLYSKKVPTRDVLSHFSSPKQLTKTVADQRTFDSCGRRRPSDSTGNNNNVSNKHLKFQSSKGVAVNYGQKGDKYDKTEPSVQASIILESDFMYRNPLTPDGSSYASIPNQNMGNEENIDTLLQENDKVVQEMEDSLDYVSSFPDIALSDKTGKKSKNMEDTRLLYEQILSMLSYDQITVTSASRLYAFTQTLRTGVAAPNTGIEENKDTLGHEKDNVDQEKKNRGFYVSVVLNQERNSADVLFSCLLMKQDKLTYLKLAYETTTSPEKTGEELIEYINATAGFRCKHELIVITLYRNNSNNEIRRVVRSTDMIDSKATHLFGPEKTKILFDLLVEKCVHFESTGTISGFVPNMAEYAVRQNVISLLVHAVDFLNILLIFFSSCPDINSLQKMTDKEIKSLMLQAIDYASLKGKSKKGAKPSLKVTKGIKYITVDSDEFLRAMGGEIPEDILYLHRHGEEMIVHRFDDTRHQPSDRNENRPIHSIYFPSDCRLFIYIPTENGSYWHQLDMQRASRIHDMSR